MSPRLKRQIEKEQQEQINERLYALLKRQHAKLTEAQAELDALTYSIAHDLRAPVRALSAFVEIMNEEHAHEISEEGRSHLEVIARSAAQTDRMLQDLLKLSQVTRCNLSFSNVDMTKLARSVIEELKEKYHDQALVFDLNDLPSCWADAELMRQVWRSLVDNAIKFASSRAIGRIEIGGSEDPSTATFFVRDNGQGLDMRYSSRLFKPFQRLHKRKDDDGNGIGLALAQRIIRRHNGKIWIESALGEGTCAHFSISKLSSESEDDGVFLQEIEAALGSLE